MNDVVAIPSSLPGLQATRATIASPHTVVKEHHGVGRIEHGDERVVG